MLASPSPILSPGPNTGRVASDCTLPLVLGGLTTAGSGTAFVAGGCSSTVPTLASVVSLATGVATFVGVGGTSAMVAAMDAGRDSAFDGVEGPLVET